MKRQFNQFVHSTTSRLALTYLAIIMLMSIGFSIVFYNTSAHELDRQRPPSSYSNNLNAQINTFLEPPEVQNFLNRRADEGHHILLVRLFILNGMALVVGGAVSYLLARRSLQPIEAAMEAQSQFVSDASHELRTPLTAIRTSNDVALRNKKLTLADAKEIIGDNTEEVIKLKQLSDALLDLAKGDHGVISLRPLALQAAVSQAINQVVSLAQAKNISIDDQTANLTILSENTMLYQILVIFLDNAIKYSPDKSVITVTTSQKGRSVLLQINDQGIGIRASDLNHVFRRFYRVDSSRSGTAQNGYGLGLAIAERLAQRLGTSLQVHSELGKGSSFGIRIPVQNR